jgi:hypothetical protein
MSDAGGGPIDFESMDDDELEAFLEKRYNDALARLMANAPSCLDGFIAAQTNDLDQHRFDGHGEPLNKVYALKCTCGSERLAVIGYHTTNPDFDNAKILVSPISLRCTSCGRDEQLFDTQLHGFDAELESHPTHIRARGERGPFACACGGTNFKPFARFEFSSETLEDSTGEWTGNEHNLFSWFTLVGDCASCGKRVDIAEFETA